MPELTEPIESINKQLITHFGIDTISSQPMWRVVWSEDQFEHRYGTYEDRTPSGLFIREVTEVRYVPKYRQWISNKFVLERLCAIPVVSMKDLPATKISYEPIYVFEDKNGNYLPPKFNACKFVIDTVYAVQYADHSLARYKDPLNDPEQAKEDYKKKIDGLVDELFGDQSSLQGTTKTGESIIVPHSYKGQE